MATECDAADLKFEAYELSRSEKACIGKVVLLAAELDHLLTIALSRKSEMHADVGLYLFSRSQISTKVKNLRWIIKSGSDEVRFGAVAEEIDDYLILRNTFAHGVYMGVVNETHIAFIVSKDPSADEEDLMFKVKRVPLSGLKAYCRLGQRLVNDIKAIFGVESLQNIEDYRLIPRKSRTQ